MERTYAPIQKTLYFLSDNLTAFVFADSLKNLFSGSSGETALSLANSVKLQDITKSHCSIILDDALENYTQES